VGQRYTESIYPIAGAFADWLGNYRAGFTLIASLAVVGSLFFWMVKRPV
jgi:hypothetical protein